MKPVILSADGEAMLYSVPDAVAEHLEDCCMAFCTRWLWELSLIHISEPTRPY